MATVDRSFVEKLLNAFESKDVEALVSAFADDGFLFDPHYPTPELRGKEAIRQGMQIALGTMKQPGFRIRNVWSSGDSGAVEVDTHHVLANGIEVRFPQVFVIETRDGLITRLQSYVPYPPPQPPA